MAQAKVVGVPSEKWGESRIAVVVLASGASVTEAELIAWSREQMAHFKCRLLVAFVDALPLSGSGKLLKTELRARFS